MSCGKLLTDVFGRVYVINLPYKEDRRRRLAAHMERTGLFEPGKIKWVTAVSGDLCPPPDYFKSGNGAWGCLQSHIGIVQDAIMSGLESYLVVEDDVVFHEHAAAMAARFLEEVPDDWGQLYLGGQHLRDPEQVTGRPFVLRCHNVNRTHAFALHRRAMVRFQQHVCHAPDYIARDAWHIDHQLGMAHERGDWITYAPAWWIAGQEGGASNISGRVNPRLWWHPAMYSGMLPFVYLSPASDPALAGSVREFVHFGNNLKVGTCEDIGLDACAGSDEMLAKWLAMIASEAIDLQMLPGIQHSLISRAKVAEIWRQEVLAAGEADLERLVDYPFNCLFNHPLNHRKIACSR